MATDDFHGDSEEILYFECECAIRARCLAFAICRPTRKLSMTTRNYVNHDENLSLLLCVGVYAVHAIFWFVAHFFLDKGS